MWMLPYKEVTSYKDENKIQQNISNTWQSLINIAVTV